MRRPEKKAKEFTSKMERACKLQFNTEERVIRETYFEQGYSEALSELRNEIHRLANVRQVIELIDEWL